MKDGFTRKKVESLTLGEKLRKLRSDFRMSLGEVSKATKIQVKYLELLENGEYEKLPADVYVRGFLRSYARYLSIDEQSLINVYERERHIQTNLNSNTPSKKTYTAHISLASLVVTPRAIVMSLLFVFVCFSFFYLFRELQAFIGVPRLVITAPLNGEKIKANEVIVQGKTDKGARVSINNQSVFVGSEGDFSDTIILQRGFNTMTITAVNRFEKEKKETLTLEVDIPLPEAQTSSEISPVIEEDLSHVLKE